MTPEQWLAKGERALNTAIMTLATGDIETACNRAYYAMFNAARAALLSVGQDQAALAKTHSRLIGAFGEHLVRTGQLPTMLGRAIANASYLRLLSDYNEAEVDRAEATTSVEDAKVFVTAIKDFLSSRNGAT